MKVSLGKFGRQHCDLPSMFSNVAYFLHFVTINIDKNNDERIPIASYVLVIMCGICYVYTFIFSMLWFVFIRCRDTGDFTAAAVAFSLGTISENCVTKFTFMILNKTTLQDLVQRYLECDRKVTPGTRFHDNLQKRLLKIKERVMLTWIFFITISISYTVLPLFLPGKHFPQDSIVLYGLEPMFESPNYEIALISESITALVCNYLLANIFSFILIIIGYIEAQMLALSDEVLSLWEDGEVHYYSINRSLFINSTKQKEYLKKKIINEHIADHLKQVIAFHTTNINLLNDFEKLFRVTMAIEFGIIVISIVAELLGRVENTFLELPYTFIQLYVNCLIGQKLIDASDVFVNGVYNCKWENFDKSNMKNILFVLQSAQKPLKLTAGGLATLDFVCLMSMLKSTYSFYTTLKSTVG